MAGARIGERYSKIDGPASVWEVVTIHVDPNGIRHCRIANVSDRTNTKMVSEKTLTKGKFYRRLGEAVPSYDEVE